MDRALSEGQRDYRHLKRTVQTEAGSWGIFSATYNAFINPLLISRDAGALALGIFNSGANLLGFGAGWIGPRIAARIGSVAKATLICLIFARLMFICIPLTLIVSGSGRVGLLVALVLAWSAGEGLALPLWTSFIAGMVRPQERGRWLAMRASAATGCSAVVLLSLAVLLRFTSKESALPFAFSLAGICSILALVQLRWLFANSSEPPIPTPRSARHLPAGADTRRFLAGTAFFWFGAGFVWPVLPKYIIDGLDGPTWYFAIASFEAAIIGLFIQRRWGKIGDEAGAKRVLLIGGIGSTMVPALWSIVPVFWLGFAVEIFGSLAWPAHMMGLTLRSIELAENESDRPNLLAWTNLAQGAGACLSPLISSALVGQTGAIPLLLVSSAIRGLATFVMLRPGPRQAAVPA
jgi:MFS family permease